MAEKIKILIANRSEIACRIAQTCRELGFSTVGIYSKGDEEGRHLKWVDESHLVPSYLDIAAIVEVAKKSGASAVHPGYGFLSERPPFAEAVEKAGILFVGPTPESMRAMGGKIDAKKIAEKAGVPTLPWTLTDAGASASASASPAIPVITKAIGFPCLVKAAAGGGGKGMRIVEQEADFAEALQSASSEALASFGDGTLFVEKLLLQPRHIEVQVFGNGQGGGIHLFERECSLQRRHQKVWEEAPAPLLDEKIRQKLYQASMNLMKETRYRNAGTLEFLLDDQGDVYFLEMNTRLQVEHPVTEQVSGVDLVALQLKFALGWVKPEEIQQYKFNPKPFGHSIEVRIYAEDPAKDFFPTPGKVERLQWPTGAGIRVEAGIDEGQTVGTLFDSMLGKLIVHADTRANALRKMTDALKQTKITGSIGTNLPYLLKISEHPVVIEGKVHTSWLEKNQRELTQYPAVKKSTAKKAGGMTAGAGPSTTLEFFYSPWIKDSGAVHVAAADEEETESGEKSAHEIADEIESRFKAQFPGKIKKVFVKAGASVEAEEALCSLEAMKMEFMIRAPIAGKVDEVLVTAGQQVQPGDRFFKFSFQLEASKK